MSKSIIDWFCRLHDRINSQRVEARLDVLVVRASIASFLLHLLIISVARLVPGLHERLLPTLSLNYLHAVYTPFSFILFYEVLLLVFAISGSLTGSLIKQYEIISLIVVRRVFKDIGAFENIDHWLDQPQALKLVFIDMGGALVMFLLVILFYRLRKTVRRSKEIIDLKGFIRTKKVFAVLLGGLLIALAMLNLATWVLEMFNLSNPLMANPADKDDFFFPAFFEVMIFADVFLLIVSIIYYDQYHYVFRNAGFLISTILLRVSLSTAQPFDVVLGLAAMVYGIGVLLVFTYATRVRGCDKRESADAAFPSDS